MTSHSFWQWESHNRVLCTKDSANAIIDKVSLRNSLGECRSYLFEDSTFYIVVDCDGSRFKISKETGVISEISKLVHPHEVPNNFLGVFMYIKPAGIYDLDSNFIPSFEDMTKFRLKDGEGNVLD